MASPEAEIEEEAAQRPQPLSGPEEETRKLVGVTTKCVLGVVKVKVKDFAGPGFKWNTFNARPATKDAINKMIDSFGFAGYLNADPGTTIPLGIDPHLLDVDPLPSVAGVDIKDVPELELTEDATGTVLRPYGGNHRRLAATKWLETRRVLREKTVKLLKTLTARLEDPKTRIKDDLRKRAKDARATLAGLDAELDRQQWWCVRLYDLKALKDNDLGIPLATIEDFLARNETKPVKPETEDELLRAQAKVLMRAKQTDLLRQEEGLVDDEKGPTHDYDRAIAEVLRTLTAKNTRYSAIVRSTRGPEYIVQVARMGSLLQDTRLLSISWLSETMGNIGGLFMAMFSLFFDDFSKICGTDTGSVEFPTVASIRRPSSAVEGTMDDWEQAGLAWREASDSGKASESFFFFLFFSFLFLFFSFFFFLFFLSFSFFFRFNRTMH